MNFKIAVGDWSDDGHGKCDYVTVGCKCDNIEEIRELYFEIKDKFGLDIGSIAEDYGDNRIDEKTYAILKEFGFKFEEGDFEILEECEDYDFEGNVLSSDAIAKIVVFMLNKVKPEYCFGMNKRSEIPMLQFYGFDKKGRHLSVGGYGLFD